MRIIDNKGKLFGKINIIDLIAVVLILAVAALLGTKRAPVGTQAGVHSALSSNWSACLTNQL